jgi:hypothetical protein
MTTLSGLYLVVLQKELWNLPGNSRPKPVERDLRALQPIAPSGPGSHTEEPGMSNYSIDGYPLNIRFNRRNELTETAIAAD